MKRILLMLLLFYSAALVASGQKNTEDFKIALPSGKISGSLYKSIKLIDKRADTSDLGIVQLGAFNKKARVIAETPLERQLTDVMKALIDETAKDGELLLLLRQFSLAEITGALSEKGYCYLRAVLFGSDNGQYLKLAAVDTVIVISSFDVTKALLRQGGGSITDFIKDNIRKQSADTIHYSLAEVASIDSIEKRRLPVYNTTEYRDGPYKTFNAFVSQQPESEELLMEFWKTKNIKSIQVKNNKGKFVKAETDQWYALVYKGQPYITTGYGVYPLEKRGDDFYFTGKAKTSASTGDVAAATFFFGIIGGLIASSAGSSAVFEMKIDHLSGGFIRIREVKK